MSQKPIELHFWPGEGAAVRDLRAMRARPDAPEFIGMRHDSEAGGLVATGEPGRVVVLPQHATLDLAAYAKDVRAGHLVPADRATADRFGVKFVPSESAAPAEAEPGAAGPLLGDLPPVGPGVAPEGLEAQAIAPTPAAPFEGPKSTAEGAAPWAPQTADEAPPAAPARDQKGRR